MIAVRMIRRHVEERRDCSAILLDRRGEALSFRRETVSAVIISTGMCFNAG